jgi:hypothetical protein
LKQESEGFCGRQLKEVPNSLAGGATIAQKNEANIIRLSPSCGQHNMGDIWLFLDHLGNLSNNDD